MWGCIISTGLQTTASGDKYVGQWKDGKKHGQGMPFRTLASPSTCAISSSAFCVVIYCLYHVCVFGHLAVHI